MRIVDLTGKKFGKLIVVSLSHMKGRSFWKCKCECGKECIVKGSKLGNGQTRSCGCIRATRNGLSKHELFALWANMISRCENKNNISFRWYGAKGIKVCERWKSFDYFLEDIGKRPYKHELDRIDTNGNYCKDNCRWVTSKQNQNNRNKRSKTKSTMY